MNPYVSDLSKRYFPSPHLRGNFLTSIQLFIGQKVEPLSSQPLMLDPFTDS